MSQQKFKMMKVFESRDMSDEVFDGILKMYDFVGNDCYVSHIIGDEYVCDDDSFDDVTQIIDNWLIENGCVTGEKVMLSHTW